MNEGDGVALKQATDKLSWAGVLSMMAIET